MQLTHMHHNLCKHFFSNIIVAVWNSLPNIVISAESTNIVKNYLDKFRVNQEFKFYCHANNTRIGSRSINSLNYVQKCLFGSDMDIEA